PWPPRPGQARTSVNEEGRRLDRGAGPLSIFFANQPSSPFSAPVLSPSFATFTLARSSIDTHRLFSGVSLAYLTCRPLLMVPHPLPASRIGRSSWLWALPSLLPLP